MAKANNTVLVIRGSEDNLEIVASFTASDEVKTPGKAAKAFLEQVYLDTNHPLHSALQSNELSTMGGHPRTVEVTTTPTITL